mmetsp:Transcript_28296/g.65180  ORF Transcript_28296/g.65180 Transcript_28296/m.65180 type:complete len:1554 (+) Transcript_28296:189-4850(+)|eukprot:CAMPEP_0114559882 /NCGR_PEP_ID=MMETSP0114-20121206/11156_1 /TAXON_ID=31324 /ORGANISM="Goniomonas sp, Strain m" /LENGTH=1553 /DNA_ID=CAMNT_0001745377 /DNA_START=186 /DNA_END=4847 /DNA_ORIENTATION=+
MTHLAQRQRVWIANGPDEWVPCELVNLSETEIQVKTEDGGAHTFQCADVRMFTRNPPNMEGIDDLLQSPYLDEPNILYSLEARFKQNKVYTATGPIMIAVNPWQAFDIYNTTIVQQYAQMQSQEGATPHIFLVSGAAFKAMVKSRKNQSILISGESGAGKTESTKYVMQFLATVGGRGAAQGGGMSVEQQVLESNPVLEAFGNAKTLRNDNSSRFGKYIDIHFDSGHLVCGCSIQTYLLERSRVTAQAKGERNYHIFYQLCAGAGADPQLMRSCQLGPPSQFRYLTSGDCTTVPSINDGASFERMRRAMGFIGLDAAHQQGFFATLASILHLGNLDLQKDKDDSAILNTTPAVQSTCALLGITPAALQTALCSRQIKAGVADAYSVPQGLEPASAALVSLAKTLYARLFKKLVARLNEVLQNLKYVNTIAVLDIFGFEHFQKNFFEQFCINYANEKLQQHFNQYNFTLEQAEYDKEGIPWSSSDFVDNALCLELIEKKQGGVLSILDEECIVPQGTDESFLEKLVAKCEQNVNPHFRTTKNRREQFVVVHYAGEVTYTVLGFTVKNKDELQPDLVDMMKGSTNPFLKELFEQEEAAAKPGGVGGRSGRSTLIFQSITAQFKSQLALLMTNINATDPHFVRCINPNGEKKAMVFERVNVLKQLRCGGVIEAVRMARDRFPCRYPHEQFLFGFCCLVPQLQKETGPAHGRVNKLLQNLQVPADQVKVGKTKVFLRREVVDVLEKRRSQLVGKFAIRIQRNCRRFMSKRKVTKLKQHRKAVQCIQRQLKRAICRARAVNKVLEERQRRYVLEQQKLKQLEEKRKQQEDSRRQQAEADASRSAQDAEAARLAGDQAAAMAAQQQADAANAQAQQLQEQQMARDMQQPAYGGAPPMGQMSAAPMGQMAPMGGPPPQSYGGGGQQYPGQQPPAEDGASQKPSPLCIRIQVHAVEGGVTSTYVFHVDKLAASLRNSVTVKDRKTFLKFYPQSFLGSDAIDWLRGHALTCLMDMQSSKDEEKTKRLSRSVALLLGQKLLDVGVFRQVTGSPTKPLEDTQALFRFHEDEKEGPLLNCRRIWYQNAREPLLVVSELLRRLLSLDFRNPKLKESSEMRDLTAATAELQLVNINGLSRAELLAFFLNAFNLMVLHGHIVRGTPDSTTFKSHRVPFMRMVQYMIAAYNYSLEEIEGRLFCRVMRAKYPRKSDNYKAPEPRVHFALSLGAQSSPRIRIYTSQGLERELEAAAIEYCNPIEFNEQTREVTLPKVFKWHKEDFGSSKADVLRYYAKYAPEEVRRQIILMATSNIFKIRYRKFMWNISFDKICTEAQLALKSYNDLYPMRPPIQNFGSYGGSSGGGGGGHPSQQGRSSMFPGGGPVPNPGMSSGGMSGEYEALDQVSELPVTREQRGGQQPQMYTTEAAALYQSSSLLSAEVDAPASASGLVHNRSRALQQALPEDDPTGLAAAQAQGGAPPEANLYGTMQAPAYGPASRNTPNPEYDGQAFGPGGGGYGGPPGPGGYGAPPAPGGYGGRAATGMMPSGAGGMANEGEFRRPGQRGGRGY